MSDELFLSKQELEVATQEEIEALARRLFCVYLFALWRKYELTSVAVKVYSLDLCPHWLAVAREAMKAVK